MKLLILGGSGFVSGRASVIAMEKGHEVWTVTRGLRPIPDGAHPITADRTDENALRAALAAVGEHWDAVIDCTCRTENDAAIDLKVLPPFVRRAVIISTDSVYNPAHKTNPQAEEADEYMSDGGYGNHKRRMELEFINSAGSGLSWTIFRPGHIFGPGSQVGCYPEHSRQKDLIEHIRAGKPLRLVGGGKFLIHPIYMDDLVLDMLAATDESRAVNQIFCIGGPDIVTNAEYFRILGSIIGTPVSIEEIPLDGYLEKHPEYSGHLCERAYSLEKLKSARLPLPATHLRDGLKRQVEWLEAQGK